ncbi:MAG: hypothetical protein AB8B91_14185 [Rubripirellula sp.]
MWTTDQLGLAVWKQDDSAWYIDARGGDAGIGVVGSADGFAAKSRYVSFLPVDEHKLPAAAEQYVRGNQWHVNYPQDDSSYALRLAFEAIETEADSIVLEVTISLQTDLLDLHPKLDVEVLCQDIDSFVPTDQYGGDEVAGAGSAPISLAKNPKYSTSVLLGPHDSPFTTNHSSDMALRLRLFGDFLEKGVIRKARPWIKISRDSSLPKEADLEACWMRLCESPLPLAP